MISSEVQRTLVKSPPELWAEISDPASLARHLGEFGEIRITRVEPEQRVEWEADKTSGSVVIKPSGWGTKVELAVTREAAQLGDSDTAIELQVEAVAEPEVAEPEVAEPALAEPALAKPERTEIEDAQREEAAEPEPLAEAEQATTLEPRRGFFARLFGRRRPVQAVGPPPRPRANAGAGTESAVGTEADAEAGSELEANAPPDGTLDAPGPERYNALAAWASQIEPEATAEEPWEPEGVEPAAAVEETREPADVADATGAEDAPDGERPSDISAETAAAEEVVAEEVTAVLTGVLDRLGAAHHRPFSRS